MKFEKFLKMAGVHGVIVNAEDYGKFLAFANAMIHIPEGVNVVTAFERNAKDWEKAVLSNYYREDSYTADLTAATLPTPDAKPSQIQRIFSDQDGGKIAIDNKFFGIIERMDGVRMTFDENDDPTALIITEGYGADEMLAGVIFAEEYCTEHMEV